MAENNLKQYIDDFFDELELYDDYKNGHNYKDLLHASVIRFLDYENTYTAYDIYENFFMIYQITDEDKSDEKNAKSYNVSRSNTLLKLVNMMKDYEDNTGKLIEKQRDHFIHSVNVFVLGLAIYSQNVNYQDVFEEYILESPYEKYYRIDGEVSSEEFLYRWGIASLFHDIGYPVEIIGKQLAKFVNDGSTSISSKYKVDTAVNFKNFNELNTIVKVDPNFPEIYRRDYPETNFINLYKPTDIMAHQIFTDFYVAEGVRAIDEYDKLSDELNRLISHLDNFTQYMAENRFIDHGYFSSIFVLNSYAALMQKYYHEQKIEKYAYFFYPVLNSATSILLHNYYRGTLQNPPFNLGKMEPRRNPLAFMLILCDELQEWNRRPIGVKDLKKNHVNDIKIDITNSKLNVEYILKNSALGLGFSEDKEGLINKLLDVEAIFDNGLNVDITTDLDADIQIEDTGVSETEAPNILLRNIEQMARASHERYNEIEVAKGNPSRSYDEMDASMKLSSVRQAKSFPYKLNMVGCEIVPVDDPRPEHILTDDEIEIIAVVEHEDWCREKRNTGWISPKDALKNNLISEDLYNELMKANEEDFTSNVKNKYEWDGFRVHANLVGFDELNSDSQEKDRRPVREIPEILKNVKDNPLKIVQTNLRRFTLQMHETYTEFCKSEDIPEFKDLPFEVRHNNYLQTLYITKLLSELHYEIVPLSHPGRAIEQFEDDKEIEYLARNEHNAWYLKKINQGYVYGPKREGMKNPKLKPWDELRSKYKKLNRQTFKSLPETCRKVNLKIVKS